MQCARCANPLPADALFCPACGQSVATNSSPALAENASTQHSAATPENVSQENEPPALASGAGQGNEMPASGVGQGNEPPAPFDFAFQEFNGVPASSSPVSTPAFFPPAGMPGQASPYAMPPVPMPVMPGQPGPYAVLPAQGMVSTVPYALPPGPLPPGQFPPYAVPGAPVPAQPKRQGHSVGCIVLYGLLAIVLIFVGLGVGAYAIGAHLSSVNQANQAAAMRLYQQVTSETPTTTDSLTNTAYSEWRPYQRPTYGCSPEQDGLHIHITDANHFAYCLNDIVSYTDFAFQVQMSILSGAAGGLVFRLDSVSSDFYFFQIGPSGIYSVFLDKKTSSAPKSLASGSVNASSLQLNQTSTLTVIARGSTFDFYIGQQFIVQVQDSTLKNAGYLGMISYDQGAAAEAVYTNAKIWDLDQ